MCHALGLWLSLSTSHQLSGRLLIATGSVLIHIAFITTPFFLIWQTSDGPFWRQLLQNRTLRPLLCTIFIGILSVIASIALPFLVHQLQLFLLVSNFISRLQSLINQNLGRMYHYNSPDQSVDSVAFLELP
jgi:hypothetical protein